MRTKSIAIALGLCAALLSASAAPTQKKKTVHHTTHKVVKKKAAVAWTGVETSLVGVKLFDSGQRVIALYGSPDQIQPVGIGAGAAGPSAGGPAGPTGAPGGNSDRGGKMNPTFGAPGGFTSPGEFSLNDPTSVARQGAAGAGITGANTAPAPMGVADEGGSNGGGAGPGRNPGAANPNGPGAGGPGGSNVVYTRWVYNRNGSKYGFIFDKYNHVVQCEAVGMQSGKAKTRRGVTFGSTFGTIIKKYGAPDGYEISGDNIVVRYLNQDKCAFRLSRLGKDKPHVVTGILVAAGKR